MSLEFIRTNRRIDDIVSRLELLEERVGLLMGKSDNETNAVASMKEEILKEVNASIQATVEAKVEATKTELKTFAKTLVPAKKGAAAAAAATPATNELDI
jgi:hypothetical protein